MTALVHREPDRIPYDFGGTDTNAILIVPYLELAKKLGIDPYPVHRPCPTGGTVNVASAIIDALGGDTRLVTRYPREHTMSFAIFPESRVALGKKGDAFIEADQGG